MPLFRCEKCGCIENTALGHYWGDTEFSKALCSECEPPFYPDGSVNKSGSKWHNKFPKEQATEKDKGSLLNW